MRHLIENLMGEVSKLGIRRNASEELVQDMFNRVAYTTSAGEYDSAMAELRRYKRELAIWVEEHEPECWTQSKFTKKR